MTLALLALVLATEPSDVTALQNAERYVIAEGKGEVAILSVRDTAVSKVTFFPGAKVPEHKHEASSETLVVLEGTSELVIRGTKYVLKAGDTVHIPKGDLHSASVPADAKGPFVAIQIYAPAGPEERFRKGKKL